MAIIKDGVKTFEGAVIKLREHYWLDGMLEEYATVWDMESHTAKEFPYGYYGIDGHNLYGDSNAEIDCSVPVARDIIRTVKVEAYQNFAGTIADFKKEVHKGDKAEVIRGRKVKKGTILTVFWVGDKPTYKAKASPSWSWYANETERIAGCHDENGNVIWIKAEYLKNLMPYKSPCAAERKKYIKAYIKEHIDAYIINIAESKN